MLGNGCPQDIWGAGVLLGALFHAVKHSVYYVTTEEMLPHCAKCVWEEYYNGYGKYGNISKGRHHN